MAHVKLGRGSVNRMNHLKVFIPLWFGVQGLG